MSNQSKSININRNLRPAGALGNAGAGACSTSSPLLFSTSNPTTQPLAIARAGGTGGQIYVYAEDGDNTSYASFAGGGRQWGDDNDASESSETTRESLMSYLHEPLSQPPGRSLQVDPLTPPSSFTPSVDIPFSTTTQHSQSFSLPLTPVSSSSLSDPTSPPLIKPTLPRAQSQSQSQSHKSTLPTKQERQIISLISSIFPNHFTSISNHSTTLEIVTPPSNVLKGFIVDTTTKGRTVFVHMESNHPTPITRPETLSPNFSQVLRPHDPLLSISPPTSSSSAISGGLYGMDIRESLTALLDLSSDALEANNLVLVLDREESEQESLAELLHSLMYVGGQVLKSPSKVLGGWEWDIRKWVLVGLEL
ncbi:hypothetical protein I302_108460 [Kwoniella bestiolae CBS 10118]|uniref:Uncharacterized protein n=1 Tax=Kwoniella bestiolae CBS 10118 TaxID=1296100 RepID=A0A1B9FVP8_9TREE|nr:hypothetical protein I302_07165 [Kwoniella bestiolae CBS 10118]OCF22821.1 hypothetical protein I302_07165 [Kwoniella bestiolae CBS 10118]